MRLLLALVALLAAGTALAGDVPLSWQHDGKNTDGTAAELAGFRIRYGTDALDRVIDVPNGGLRAYVVTDLVPGFWKFTVSAYSVDGESVQSNIATRLIEAAPPSPVPSAPGVLTVTASRQVYVIKQTVDRVSAVPVGTVPADTRCIGSNGIFFDGRVLFKVPVAAVIWSGSVRSVVVVADCS